MVFSTSALRHKSFRDLWIGQTISQLGDSTYYLVFLFVVDHITKNPMMVGLVGMFSAIPFVIFGPFAGVLVDRVDRRKLMLGSELWSAGITLGLAVYAWLRPEPEVWVMCAAAFLMSIVNTVFFPARSASIPRLVPAEDVVKANALSEATRQVVSMLGIGFSAVALGALYKINPDYFFFSAVLVNGLTFLASAFFVRKLPELLPLREEIEEVEATGVKGNWERVKKDLREGIRAILDDPVVRRALPINMISTIGVAGFFVVYLALNREWYGGGYNTLAWIEFSFIFPTMLASLYVGRATVVHPGRWLLLGQFLIGLTVVLMAFSKPYWMMLLANVLCGLTLPFMIIPLQSYLQLAIPDQLRGRVNSAWLMISQAMNPVGVVLVGPILAWLGIEGTLIIMGLILSGACLVGVFSRSFMNTRMPVTESSQAA
jgi:MFS transporter, DHA3 family, macrolide efflux protein